MEEADARSQSIKLNDAQLGYALDFALDHAETPAGSGAVLGSLATLRRDTIDDELLEMAKTVVLGLVQRDPAARQAAQRWRAQRLGCNPDGDAAEILDLESQLLATLNLYRRTDGRLGIVVESAGSLSYPTVPIGAEAIEAFRADYLVPRFGEHAASARLLRKWFDKLDQPKASGGLSLLGIVARVLHLGRRGNPKRPSLEKTVQRVDRVLASHAKQRK